MIADIIKQKSTIMRSINNAGIPNSNLLSVFLFGSHYWGYNSKKSDIDLYILLKKKQKKIPDIGNISLHYQITQKKLNQKINSGSWASYYVLKYASYLLYGKRPYIPKYNKKNILPYLEEHKIDELPFLKDHSRRWAYLTLMKRLFYVNYFFNDIKTFKLTDFQFSPQLNIKEKDFLEEQYPKVFDHESELKRDILKIKKIILKVENYIYSHV